MAKSSAAIQKRNVFDVVKSGVAKPVAPLAETGVPVSPYVQFAHPQAKNFTQMTTALRNLSVGTPVLVNSNEFIKLDPFNFIAITDAYHQCFAKYDHTGEIVGTREPVGRTPSGYSETVTAVILLVVGNDIMPARCRFKGPKVPGIRNAINAVDEQCRASDFAQRGKDHAKIAKSGLPEWAWLVHTGIITEKKGKDSGMAYHELQSSFALSTLGITGTLLKLQNDEGFVTLMSEILEDHNEEVEKLDNLLGK
jgi:hypothetical protein